MILYSSFQVQTESDEIDGAQAVEDLNILKSQLEAVKRDEQVNLEASNRIGPLWRKKFVFVYCIFYCSIS